MVAGPSWAPARVSRRDEIEGDAVQAVAEPGRRGTVLEHVAEMPAAAATMHLGPDQEQTMVLRGANAARERRPEARPTVPLSNLVSDEKSGKSQPAQR